MRRLGLLVNVLGVCLLVLAQPMRGAERSADFEGAWVMQITDRNPLQQLIILRQEARNWTGTMTSRFGTIALGDIVVDGEQVAFSQRFDLDLGPVRPIRVYGALRNGELRLRMPFPTGGGYVDRVARRASAQEVAAIEAATPANKPLQPLPSNGLARTPPMGWNSWNHFGTTIDDRTVRETADAMVRNGLREAGYVYVIIDEWAGGRDAKGELVPNSRFPDMKALADYVHARGLKFGLYSGPGPRTCAGYEGSYGHEERDAQTFAAWGVDYLLYDWCSANFLHTTPAEMQAAYHKMGAALQASGRPIFYALCQYGLFDVGKWGTKVGGNSWRTTFDIRDYWSSMEANALAQIGREGDAGPGGWNDPDMLEVGNGGMSLEEYRTHMTWWAVLSAPLLLGNDVRHMTPEIKALLTNKEVIAINQDSLGMQASALRETTELWSKPLADGSIAVALINREAVPVKRSLPWAVLNLKEVGTVRDVWKQADLDPQLAEFSAEIPAHGSVLLRVSAKKRSVAR